MSVQIEDIEQRNKCLMGRLGRCVGHLKAFEGHTGADHVQVGESGMARVRTSCLFSGNRVLKI